MQDHHSLLIQKQDDNTPSFSANNWNAQIE